MKKNNRYPEDFKREAVARCAAVGPTQTCKELNVAPSALYRWKEQYGDFDHSKSTKAKPSYEDLEKENRRLKKELGYMDEINKVLKKSTAIFSSDHIKNSK